MPLTILQKKKEKEDKDKEEKKSLPTKSSESNSAQNAANFIRNDTIKRTEYPSRQAQRTPTKQQSINNKYYKSTASEKKSYKIGGYGAERGEGIGELKRFSSLRDAIEPTNPNADAYRTIRESRKTGTQTVKQGGHNWQNLNKTNKNLFNNERHQAYSSPETRAVAQEVFATNPVAKFLGNMSESFIDFSPIGTIYSTASGESVGTEMANENPELYQRMNSGLSARAGDFVGAALGTKMLDLPFQNWANAKANAVLNTRLGQTIRNGAVNGRIGQFIGRQAMDERLRNYVADTILNSTIEAGQNAAAVYGEGYRERDLVNEALKQTAFDIGLSSAFNVAGLGANAFKVNKQAKAVSNINLSDMLANIKNKDEYLDALGNLSRPLKEQGVDSGAGKKIRDASGVKGSELTNEYRKVLNMTNDEFDAYRRRILGLPEETVANTNNRINSINKNAVSPKARVKEYPHSNESDVDYSVTQSSESNKIEKEKKKIKVDASKATRGNGSVRYRETNVNANVNKPINEVPEEKVTQKEQSKPNNTSIHDAITRAKENASQHIEQKDELSSPKKNNTNKKKKKVQQYQDVTRPKREETPEEATARLRNYDYENDSTYQNFVKRRNAVESKADLEKLWGDINDAIDRQGYKDATYSPYFELAEEVNYKLSEIETAEHYEKEYAKRLTSVKSEGELRDLIKDVEEELNTRIGNTAGMRETYNKALNKLERLEKNKQAEINRYSDIKKEVRDNFPEATAEEREALEDALRHKDADAYSKAESDIRSRIELERTKQASKIAEDNEPIKEQKPVEQKKPKEATNINEEPKVEQNKPLTEKEGSMPADEDYWARFGVKEEPANGKNNIEGEKTELEKKSNSVSYNVEQKPELPDKIQQAIDGKLDPKKDLTIKEKAKYLRRLGEKVSRGEESLDKLNKRIDEHFKKANAPKVETPEPTAKKVEPPKETPTEDIPDIRKLEKGSYTVDSRYEGIGKFTGIEKVAGDKMARIEYANGDVNYIPLDKVDQYLKKYAGEDTPELGAMKARKELSDKVSVTSDDAVREQALENRLSADEKREAKRSTFTSDIDTNGKADGSQTINSNGDTYSINNESKTLSKKPKQLTRQHAEKGLERANEWKEKNLPKKEQVESSKLKEETKETIKRKLNNAKSNNSDDPRKWGNDIDSIAEHYGRQKAEYVRGTQKGWNTYQNADITPAELQARMIEDNENHIRKYVSNKKILASAEEKASKDFDQMSSTFFGNANAGRATTSQDIADGYVLAREYIKNKDFDIAMKVYSELSTMESEVGRALQAQKLFRQLTPEGRLKATISSIKRLEKARNMKFEIDAKLLDDLYNAGTEAEQLAAKKALALSVWNQVPVKFIEKLNAWRYLSMLGNLKTHNRNILGNLLLMPFRGISDGIATGIEKMGAGKLAKINLENTRTRLNRLSNEELDGLAKMYNIDVKGSGKDGAKIKSDYVTALEKKYADQEAKGRHAILNPLSKNEAETRKIAKQEFKKLRQSIELGEMKFFDRGRMKESSIFKTKILDKLEKLNTNMLEGEDVFFMRANFDNAFVEYCKANKLNPSDLDEKTLEKVVEYAYNEGLKGTYRDANSLADTINKIRKMAEVTSDDKGLKKIGKKAAGVAMDATMPFVKTPLNILKRGTLEYSPVGVLRGMLGDTGIFKAKNADDFLKSIDLISTGLTGTGTMVLGGLLASRGIVNGTLGEINDKTSYDKMLGKQNYAVNFAEDFPWEYLSGKSITLDWIAPESIPFFVGVETGTAIKNNNNTADAIGDFLMALSNISEPIFELSMLQGVENIFNTAFSEKGGLGQMARNAGYGYLSQLVPTLSGQATRTVTKDRQVALSTSSNSLTKEVQKQMGNIANKLPHINQLVNQDYVDQWGRTDSKLGWKDYRDSALENFIYPFYVSDNKVTDVDAEILRLYDSLDETDKNSVIPKFTSTAYNQKYNDKEYTMTPEQFTQYKKTVGQAKYQGLEKLFKTPKYKNASDEEKAKLISDVYSEANLKGKKEFLKEVDEEFAKAPDYYMMTKDQQAKWNSSLGFSKQAYATAYNAKLEANREKQAKYGKDLTDAEKMAVLREHGVTTIEQARAIDGNIGKTVFMKDEGAEEKWNEAFKSGESFSKVQADVIKGYEEKAKADELVKSLKIDNSVDGEENRASKLLTKYDGESVSEQAYYNFVRQLAYNNGHNPDSTKRNGTYDTKEITDAIEKTSEKVGGLSDWEKAYLFSSGAQSGWKNPYN